MNLRSGSIKAIPTSEMNAPECAKLKEKYDACFEEWKNIPLSDKVIGSKTLHNCNDSFNDYRDCVSVIMKLKISAKKAES